MEHTPPLPSGFNINGYLIQSLKQTAPLCHVYYVSDANHVPYLLREFCPQGLAVRDPESGKLRYPENTDIEREVLPLKNDFEAQFRTGSLWEIPRPGHPVPGLCHSRQPCRSGASSRSGHPRRSPSGAINGRCPLPEPGRRPSMRVPFPNLGKRKTPLAYGSLPCSCWEAHAELIITPRQLRKNPSLCRNRPSPNPAGKRRKLPNRKRKPYCPP